MEHNPDILTKFQPKHDFFIGIDSDGCVFDSMEIKQKECFVPQIIKYWRLQAISKYLREVVEFVNLYSKWRGTNRFPALVKVFDLLVDRAEVKNKKFQLPNIQPLRDFIHSGAALSNASLKTAAERTGDPVLRQTMEWSNAVNAVIEDLVVGMPPFEFVAECLEKIAPKADLIVVSQTPGEALEREWAENKIAKYVSIIAGQELGSKREHLKLAAGGKYPRNHVLMIGDALGDLEAARANEILFYPINPGREEESWKRFSDEAAERFLNRRYAGAYEEKLIKEFENILPETPPWKR